MTVMRTRQDRANEYRRLATAATAQATESLLAHVREKHEAAAARWTALAMLDEQSPLLRPAHA
jgi:hypothetical protein